MRHQPITQLHRRNGFRQQRLALITPKIHELRCADKCDHGFVGSATRAGRRGHTVRTTTIGGGNKYHGHGAPRREGSPMDMATPRLLCVCKVKSKSQVNVRFRIEQNLLRSVCSRRGGPAVCVPALRSQEGGRAARGTAVRRPPPALDLSRVLLCLAGSRIDSSIGQGESRTQSRFGRLGH